MEPLSWSFLRKPDLVNNTNTGYAWKSVESATINHSCQYFIHPNIRAGAGEFLSLSYGVEDELDVHRPTG